MNNKIKLFFVFLLNVLFIENTISQQAEWAKNFSGAGLNEGYAVAADNDGNVYTSGRFTGTLDFNPGLGINNLTSGTSSDAFISKLDALGNYEWAVQFSGNTTSYIKDIQIDINGDIIAIGYFSGTVDIDLGSGTNTVTAGGNRDLFVAKVNSAGTLVWFKKMGGSLGTESLEPQKLALDAVGNIHVTGSFQGSNLNFNPNGTFNLSSSGSDDIFILKLNNSGSFIWAKKVGASLSEIGLGIAVDSLGGVIVTGYFTGTVNFNPSGVNNITATDQEDAYILKLDTNGDFLWVKQLSGTSLQVGNVVVCDNANNIYIYGGFFVNINLNPDGVQNENSLGSQNGFIVKLQSNGSFVWGKTITCTASLSSNGLAIDNSNNFYITGNFNAATDFDPSANSNILDTLGGNDVFLAKYNSDGIFQWVYQAGSSNIERAWDVDFRNGAVYITGYFAGTANFDLNGNGLFLTATGSREIFVSKIRECFPTSGTDVQTACNTYTWIDGNTYTSNNNTATFTLTNSAGCDSVVTLNLTINTSTSSTDVQTACDAYTWIDGNTYTSNNNTATFTLTNSAGCDSVVTLNLTINTSTQITIDTAINAGESIEVGGSTYNTDSTYIITLSSISGCDSVITLNLSIITALNEYFNKSLSIYPNPVKNTFYIDGTYTKAILNDINGKRVAMWTDNETELNVSDLAKGVYLLTIVSENSIAIKKVFKE